MKRGNGNVLQIESQWSVYFWGLGVVRMKRVLIKELWVYMRLDGCLDWVESGTDEKRDEWDDRLKKYVFRPQMDRKG